MAAFLGQLNGRIARLAAVSLTKILRTILALAMLILASTAHAAIPASQRTVLTNLFTSTNGAAWTNSTNWNGAAGTECTWFGVTCDATQSNVVGINLPRNNLVGTLPTLSGLPALQTFNVENLGVSTSAPNQLTGPIPSLSGLAALQTFNVYNNMLSGPMPSLNGLTALQKFDVGINKLTGPIPSLSGLTALSFFRIDYNPLTGTIPPLTGLTALQNFYANGAQLSGAIPTLTGLTALSDFRVSNNLLTGSIPSLTGLMALQQIDVRGNVLNGSIPSLSGLTRLQFFLASSNQLTGPIPSLNGLTALFWFIVNTNQLTGPIPSLTGLNALQQFDVSGNQLTGPIPSLSGLTALQAFVVGDNPLTGSIPSLSGLLALQVFWAGSSQLTGPIPSLSGLTALQGFDVHINQLTGPIPSLAGLTALKFFTVTNNQLTGPIPSLSGLPTLQAFVVDNNQLSGPVPTPPATLTAGSSRLCTNNLTSSGVPATDSAWNTATGVNWQACQIVAAPPTCTLSASPTSVAPGGIATLTASCMPAATSFTWTGGTCPGTNGTTCTVTPTATTTYSFTGGNFLGTGNTASLTVSVQPAQAFSCTLSAIPPTISAGGSSTLTSTCTLTPDSYFWTGGTCVGTIGATCTASPSVTTEYTVTTRAGSQLFGSVVIVTVTSASAPVCELTVSPSAITAGRSATLTASCSPAATAFNWTGGSCPGTIGPTCAVTPTATTTYTVTGSNAGGAGRPVSRTVTLVAPVFPLTVTNTSTPSIANVAATLQYRPQDVPAVNNVYVFALAPAGLVKNVPVTALSNPKGPVVSSSQAADGPATCVLAQLLNGELKFASTSALQPSATGVPGNLGATVNVLNGVSTIMIGGAVFYVGYGTDPNTMIASGTNQPVATIPGANTCLPQSPQSGWWWYPLQDGRGFGIEVQGNNMFMSGYLYDTTGHATWVVAEGKVSVDGSIFSNKLYQVANGQTLTGAYKAPGSITFPGDITLSFTNARNGTLTWPGGIIPIQRFDDVIGQGNGVTPDFVPETGWWWNAAESGRGYFIEIKNNYAFIAGYMYEADGRQVWYISEGAMSTPQLFSSRWYQAANGQTLTGPYKKPIILNGNVGSASIQFLTTTTATLTLPDGRLLAITRQRY